MSIAIPLLQLNELTYEDAFVDSPSFRASIQRNEDDLEELSKWFELFMRATRSALEDFTRSNDSLIRLVQLLQRAIETPFISEVRSGSTIKTITGQLSIVQQYQKVLLKELSTKFMFPLQQTTNDKIRELRELRRTYEKALDKYNSGLGKYSSIKSIKEASFTREDSFQLYETRQSYFKVLFEYVTKINKFKQTIDNLLIEKMLYACSNLIEWTSILDSLFITLHPGISKISKQHQEWTKQADESCANYDSIKKTFNQKFVRVYSPNSKFLPTSGVEKRGYLFKKRSKGLGAWKRIFAVIEGDIFYQQTYGRHRGTVELLAETNVLLCEIRIPDNVDRRFTFEITTSQKTFTFQAENEEDMHDWIRIFENAKNHALRSSTAPGAPSSLRSSTTVSTLRENSLPSSGKSGSISTTVATSKPAITKIPYSDLGMEKWNLAFHLAFPNCASEEFVISSICASLCQKMEEQDHQRETLIQGRLFITTLGLYFHADIFGIVTTIVAKLVDINSILFSPGLFHSSIKVSCAQKITHLFKSTSPKEDSTIALIFERVLSNAKSETPETSIKLLANIEVIRKSSDGQMTANAQAPSMSIKQADLTEEVSCGCAEHLERQELSILLPLSVEALFELLFGKDFIVGKGVHEKRGDRDLEPDSWKVVNDRETREVKYMVAINNPIVKVKETICYELLELAKKETGRIYVIDAQGRTPELMYGDAFLTLTKYCLTAAGPDQSRMTITTGMKWFKSPLVKSIIKNVTLKSVSDYFKDYLEVLWKEIRRIKPLAKASPEPTSPKLLSEAIIPSVKSRLLNALVGDLFVNFRVRMSSMFQKNISIGFGWSCLICSLVLFLAIGWGLLGNYRRDSTRLYISPLQLQNELIQNQSVDRMAKAMELENPAGHDWFRSSHNMLLDEMRSAYQDFDDIRKDILQIITELNNMETNMLKIQYATLLADKLSECYGDLDRPLSSCAVFEKKWEQLKNL